ncbi:hypothetical protein L204_106030 [Cryptococcus depauperatus]|nr:hypothetical protein L204_05159 [Cryptococcus depauperatus CBS 7855]
MTPPISHPSAPSNSHWHTVSPQTRPLTLTVLDLTPLALTVSLSLTPFVPNPLTSHTHHAHGQHGHSHSHSKGKKRHRKRIASTSPGEGTDEDDVEDSDSTSAQQDGGVSFKDLLRNGILVYVNGFQSNNLFANVMDEDEEEEWEDEHDSIPFSPPATGEEAEENMEQGVTRRRPRKARFGASAALASGTGVDDRESKGGKKKDEKHGNGHKNGKNRAFLVIYGLMPAKEYEVELRVVGMSDQEGDGLVSTSVLIPGVSSSNAALRPRSRADSLRPRSCPRSRSNSLTSPSPTTLLRSEVAQNDEAAAAISEEMVIPTPVLNAVDTQVAQLRHSIAAAHSEKEHLQSQIKEARRTAQRQEASLKSEIEAVKKAIEKASSADMRAKQKALALQEQVKQGWAGAEGADQEMKVVERGLGELEEKLRELETFVEQVQTEWKQYSIKESEARETDRKTRVEQDKKLAEVASKIEKLKNKKAKRETEGQELEKRLEELEKEIEEADRRNEEEKASRGRAMPYHMGHGQSPFEHHEQPEAPFGGASRTLTLHPSLPNLAGTAYRPRGAPGYTPRFPSGGARMGTSQHSPTHQGGFYASQHALSTTSPAKVTPPPTVASTRPGANATAMPFHPNPWTANHPFSAEPLSFIPHVHRTYLPPARARSFHSPLLASESSLSSSTSSPKPLPLAHGAVEGHPTGGHPTGDLSSPAFPPLPGALGRAALQSHPGPSLASIITKAVMAPGGHLAAKPPGEMLDGSPSATPPVAVAPSPAWPPAPTSRPATPGSAGSAAETGPWAKSGIPPPKKH